MMKELGGAMIPRTFGLEPPPKTALLIIGQLPCASASVLRYTASVLVSVSASSASVTTLAESYKSALNSYATSNEVVSK